LNQVAQRFHFCPKCGGSLAYQPVKERERLKCQQCGYIFYENPIVGVAVIVQDPNGSVLLGRRSAESTYPGLWCIPCGYVEYNEDVRAAAYREFTEETGLEVVLGDVFTVLSNFHNPQTHTVGIWFIGKIAGGSPQAGDELDAIDWFSLGNRPPLAFPTDAVVLSMLERKLAGGE
jgi:ADP-ribose pyrophosphatase YjhB (NUDIX family)